MESDVKKLNKRGGVGYEGWVIGRICREEMEEGRYAAVPFKV